ncbi:LOW QUALITY PROTEIN: nucleolar complex protein 4 homolog [Ornithorhynchus anatinus]|uniref:LOW QUALITY PROTEIN: nucleolar complex protein 4 homolog n=1 Tax=Ornithorhynchus anatinus TaxID=9258 RepID=UPI0010A7F9FD|nr:LOW QUALITY PROTEIN: nucleolar complex protein 4 homolog [Ornithorhynchus anatinus]
MEAEAVLSGHLGAVLRQRSNANLVFDILAFLQSEKTDEVSAAIHTCSRLFGALLKKKELFVGTLPDEEGLAEASCGAVIKYQMWMRHRYHSCCNSLSKLQSHHVFQVQELALCTLMKFVQMEGMYPLSEAKWKSNYLFPREVLKCVVESLIPVKGDSSLLISRFQEFLEFDDIRYHVMQITMEVIARIMDAHGEEPHPAFQQNTFTLISSVSLPRSESKLDNFYVKHQKLQDTWKVIYLGEHKKVFQRMWLRFLKYKLPSSLYKKVLLIMHDTILAHMSQPTLMIDFLTRAYDIGGAISLLALNGLFVLIHQHNLEYPGFYQKLYSLLDPSIYHVKYRARFFHLADLFLSSSHLPAYLVAAFTKRLARLALTAPPEALLMVIPFICNLLRRHPACKALVHRPAAAPTDLSSALGADPYDMEEEDPAKSRALESCLWELQALQKHYHPDVARAAMVINHPLSSQEVPISELLELTSYEIFDRDFKKKTTGPVALEFIQAKGLLGQKNDICAEHFALE